MGVGMGDQFGLKAVMAQQPGEAGGSGGAGIVQQDFVRLHGAALGGGGEGSGDAIQADGEADGRHGVRRAEEMQEIVIATAAAEVDAVGGVELEDEAAVVVPVAGEVGLDGDLLQGRS